MNIRLRPAMWRDTFLLRQWRNRTRKSMIDTDKVGLIPHLTWFRRVNSDPLRGLFIVEWGPGKTRVGTARFDIDLFGKASVSVTVVPEWQGRHLGREIITLITKEARQAGATGVVAVIRRDNLASRRAFSAAGYRLAGPGGSPGCVTMEAE